MAARRVGEEMGEGAGETVGYRMRFEEVSGPKKKLWYLTCRNEPGIGRDQSVCFMAGSAFQRSAERFCAV
jgi:hypothetical protein